MLFAARVSHAAREDLLLCIDALCYAALAVEEGFDGAAEAVHAAKSHIGEATSQIAGEALQIHGGVGFTWEYDVHVFLRRAKCNQVLWGDPAWHNERLAQMLVD